MTAFHTQQPLPCIIDGKPHATKSTYDVQSIEQPGTVAQTVSCASVEDAKAACDAAKRAFPAWRDLGVPARRAIVLKAYTLMTERAPDIIAAVTKETSHSAGFAGYETTVLGMEAVIETAAAMTAALRGEVAPTNPEGKVSVIQRAPFGCVLAIAPWNAPVTLALRAVLAPLAAGNTVVLKTSEYSPTVHMVVMQLLFDAGLDKHPGVLNIVHVASKDAPEVVEAMIAHEFVRKVNFTGSTRVGRIIGQVAAKYIKPIVLELGGKNPVVVTENADIALAANNIIFGGFLHQGQICMSGSNMIVHASVADALSKELHKLMSDNAELLKTKRKRNHSGKGDETHRLRPLFDPSSGKRAKELYEDAVQHGAKVIAGTAGFEDAKVQPVIVQYTAEARLFTEEAFAPMIGMVTYKTDDEAIELANASEYGLSASVFSQDQTQAWKIASGIEAGAVHINSHTVQDDQNVPHGGWKASGFGRFNGVDGIREYTQTKTITMRPGQQLPFFIM